MEMVVLYVAHQSAEGGFTQLTVLAWDNITLTSILRSDFCQELQDKLNSSFWVLLFSVSCV